MNQSSRRRLARRGARPPGKWEVRMGISVPALFILLVVGLGVANYLMVTRGVERIEKITVRYPFALHDPQQMIQHARFLSEIRGETGHLVEYLLIALLVFAFLAFVGGVGLVSTIVHPLRQVSDAVASIARGDFNQTVRFKAGFEMEELVRNFNTMADFIGSMIEQRDDYMSKAFRVGSMIVDSRGRIVSANAMACETLGFSRSDLVGRRIEDIRKENPHLAPTFMAFCGERLRQDVSTMPTDVDLPAHLPGDKRLSVAFSFLRNERNVPTFMIFHLRDLSNIENLSEILTHTDQLASLGTFTVGLSHELRNPLGALKGAAQLLGEKIGSQTDCAPYVERIVHEVNRLDLLVEELHDYTRFPMGDREPCDLNNIATVALHQALAGISPERQAGRTVVENYAPGLPRVLVQSDRVKRAIGNVIINAYDYMPEGAILRLSTHRGRTQEGDSPVVLEIENTGSRIAPENLSKIFEPFFSTRKGGTGLGLAIAYQITLQNQARLHASSDDDRVRFEFVFHDLAAGGR